MDYFLRTFGGAGAADGRDEGSAAEEDNLVASNKRHLDHGQRSQQEHGSDDFFGQGITSLGNTYLDVAEYSVFIRTSAGCPKKKLWRAIASVCGDDEIDSLTSTPTTNGWLWELCLRSENSFRAMLQDGSLTFESNRSASDAVPATVSTCADAVDIILEVLPDTREPISYRLFGLHPDTTVREVRQAFQQYGRLLALDGVDVSESVQPEDRKRRVGKGTHRIVLLPRALDTLPDTFELIVHDDAVQASRRVYRGVESDDSDDGESGPVHEALPEHTSSEARTTTALDGTVNNPLIDGNGHVDGQGVGTALALSSRGAHTSVLSDHGEYFSASAGEEDVMAPSHGTERSVLGGVASTSVVGEPNETPPVATVELHADVEVVGGKATSGATDGLPTLIREGGTRHGAAQPPLVDGAGDDQRALQLAEERAERCARELLAEEAHERQLAQARKDPKRRRRRLTRKACKDVGADRPHNAGSDSTHDATVVRDGATMVGFAVKKGAAKSGGQGADTSKSLEDQLKAMSMKLQDLEKTHAAAMAAHTDVVESLQRKMDAREQDLLGRVALAGTRRKELELMLQAERKRHSILRHNYDGLVARRKARKSTGSGSSGSASVREGPAVRGSKSNESNERSLEEDVTTRSAKKHGRNDSANAHVAATSVQPANDAKQHVHIVTQDSDASDTRSARDSDFHTTDANHKQSFQDQHYQATVASGMDATGSPLAGQYAQQQACHSTREAQIVNNLERLHSGHPVAGAYAAIGSAPTFGAPFSTPLSLGLAIPAVVTSVHTPPASIDESDTELSRSISQFSISSAESGSTTSMYSSVSHMSAMSGGYPRAYMAVPARWDGRGSPLLLHLLYGSHVILPHLVEGLLRMCSTRNIASPVLVGASAWGAHLPAVPIDTEDLDFVLDARDERVDAGLVRDLLHGAIDHAVCHVAVQRRLAVLHGVRAATHRHGHPPRSTTADGASTKYSAELVVAVRAAEDCQHSATSHSSTEDLREMLTVTRNDKGWRVKLGHRTLIDVCTSSDAVPSASERHPLSKLMPTRYQYPYGEIEVQVRVASLELLVQHLGCSLHSMCPWRLPKDLVRLRMIGHAMWMMEQRSRYEWLPPTYSVHNTATGREAMRGIMDLLLEYDPVLLGLFCNENMPCVY
eukprot:m.1426310 g.1426310  ORF g.1426310 m.1426310 type:complete len:1150 (-) comp25065_c0_seq23:2196-5645(-)